MKLVEKFNAQFLVHLFADTLLIGAAISGLLTADSRWIGWHFSRLGEGGTFSASIFNMTLVVSAVIFFLLSLVVTSAIARLPGDLATKKSHAKTIISSSFFGVVVCLVGVSIFPFDRFPIIHNIFGYTSFYTFLYLFLIVPKILPIFQKSFYSYSRIAIILPMSLYVVFFFTKTITLLVVELIAFIFVYIWLLMFVKGLFVKAATPNQLVG